MTEAELILLDIALSKIQIGQAFRIQGPLHNALIGLHDSYSPELIDEMNKILIGSPDIIRNLLLEEDYTKCINHSTHQDILTDKGNLAKNLGGHEKYKEWEDKQNRKKNFEEFPKRKWLLYDAGKILFGLILGMLITNYVCNRSKSNNEPTNTPKKDSIQKITPSQSSPTLSGKKDSL